MSISSDAYTFDGSSQDNVLVFAGHYMHCGQLMEKGGTELRRFQASRSTENVQDEALDVYLSTRVLRCVCGFQIEVPE
ncbi:hypothetical protein J7E83_19210 [Arthrobacter sp. ISL-48]|uniref:hypothetical protein n=1 Tax=Arthrobacter sp. ISL-48 TaxID=2819110 RepID=UPI001BE5EF58|nr:hypothetical protein [Arthrobacter sp. ISL-48]MBT2534215.1 hypothetical protein [Arthrobacter sp. ISL-48]